MEYFYLTTAISYTNGPPHIGHAYEIICADILARYNRFYQKLVLFSTGTDEPTKLLSQFLDPPSHELSAHSKVEHGQKIKETASKNITTPIELLCKHISRNE